MAQHKLTAPSDGSIWVHSVGVGQRVFEGNVVLIMEIMKMEIAIESPLDGEVIELKPMGTVVSEGDVIAVIEGSA